MSRVQRKCNCKLCINNNIEHRYKLKLTVLITHNNMIQKVSLDTLKLSVFSFARHSASPFHLILEATEL